MSEKSSVRFMALAAAAAMALGLQAEVTLPQFYTDNMIVQRNATLTIPGTATPGANVTVKADWNKKAVATGKADAKGRFSLQIPTPEAGGPYTIVVSDGNGAPKVLSNVLSGEVWLCSGQSNMEFPVSGWGHVMGEDEVVATSINPAVRLLQIKRTTSFSPQEDTEVNLGGWTEANPAAMNFSAIAYLFAKSLCDSLQVPVGVIDSSWGGTPAEAWTPYADFADVPGFDNELDALKRCNFSAEGAVKEYGRQCEEWEKEFEKRTTGFDKAAMQSGADWKVMPVPGEWENSVLPGFDGVVWAQFSLNVPESAAGKPLKLHFGPIDNEDKTYFNGVQVGGKNNWRDKRHYNVPADLVKAGANTITVRIIDFDGGGGFTGTPNMYYAQTADDQSIPMDGNWNYTVACPLKDLPPHPITPQGPNYPTMLYNAMINPLKTMPVKGVLWYQGCANVGRAEQYSPLFKNLIKAWRREWKNENMPFYFVQLAGWLKPQVLQPDSEWAALRQAQADALELPGTGMAVAIDLGNPNDIHPTNKQEVARRLGLLAMNRTYGHKKLVDAAPVCSSVKAHGDKIKVKFSDKIVPKGGVLTGFIIAGADGKWAPATARPSGDNGVELSSPLVAAPVQVKYAWADHPFGSVYGTTGLPVAPFSAKSK